MRVNTNILSVGHTFDLSNLVAEGCTVYTVETAQDCIEFLRKMELEGIDINVTLINIDLIDFELVRQIDELCFDTTAILQCEPGDYAKDYRDYEKITGCFKLDYMIVKAVVSNKEEALAEVRKLVFGDPTLLEGLQFMIV